MDATQPQNDREFLIQLSGNMAKLSDSIDNLSSVVTNVEMKRIIPMEDKISVLEKWKAEMNGVWKTVIAISTVLSIISLVIVVITHLKQ